MSELRNLNLKLEGLRTEKVLLVDQANKCRAWLSNKNLVSLFGERLTAKEYQKERSGIVSKLLEIDSKVTKLKSQIVSINNKIHELKESDRSISPVPKNTEDKLLLVQCLSVFDSIEKRGIGFDVREHKIIQKLRERLSSF